jgi:hypothetical protein
MRTTPDPHPGFRLLLVSVPRDREIPLILKAERLRARRELDVSDHENGWNGNTSESEEEEADEPSEGGPGVARCCLLLCRSLSGSQPGALHSCCASYLVGQAS